MKILNWAPASRSTTRGSIFARGNAAARLVATVFATALTGAITGPAKAAVEVVTSLPELAAISKAVGGGNINVYSVAKPNQDYHFADARPSDVARVAKAQLVVRSGLGLDSWMDAILNAAGNRGLNKGGNAYVDASEGIPVIERPDASITGASGDVHAPGNPHYYYDPIYAKFVARNVLKGLLRVDEKNAAPYRANYVAFGNEIDAKMAGWQKTLAPFAGKSVVTYHRNYNYFIRRFGLKQYGTLEPVPGVPPSAAHVSQLMAQMKRDNVTAVVVEGIYPKRYPDLVARTIGAKYEYGPYSVSALTGEGYINMISSLVGHFKAALS